MSYQRKTIPFIMRILCGSGQILFLPSEGNVLDAVTKWNKFKSHILIYHLSAESGFPRSLARSSVVAVMDGKGEEEYSAREKESIFLHPADRPETNVPGLLAPTSGSNVVRKDTGDGQGNLVYLSEGPLSAERIVSDRSAVPDPFPDAQIPSSESRGDAIFSAGKDDVDRKDAAIFPGADEIHETSSENNKKSSGVFLGGDEIRDNSSGIHPRPGFLSCTISSDSLVYSTSSCVRQEDSRQPTTEQQTGISARGSEADSRCSSAIEANRCVSGSTSHVSQSLFPAPRHESGRSSGSFPSQHHLMQDLSNNSEQPVASSGILEAAPADPESQQLSPLLRPSFATPADRGAEDRLAHASTWIPVSDLTGEKTKNEAEWLRLQDIDRRIWRVRLVREVLAGLIGMQAVFALTSFVFDNAPAGVVALFLTLCSIFAHADRRPASYLLTSLIALALASTVLAALCTRVYGFEQYYVDVTLHRVSLGQIVVLLLVSISTAVLTHQTITLQKVQRKNAEISTHAGDQMVLPGVLSDVLLQRGSSNARYILRSAESTAAAAKAERVVGVSIPPPLQEEDDEAETNTDCSFDRRESVSVQREGVSRLGNALPPA
ncbi:putative transmembrane protein [Toxoplasma gondii VAND]|uniref:Putative transmembrane protein n=1 Tax=Toxoplasma gondii VAND TaxID=933077 RepID=A0A086PLC3_TOXGO|nr:putative transmembrane protein [Toxoplasma gondii VAND]